MESDRFDALTKQLATAGTSRRRLLRAFGGLVAGAVVTGIGTRTAAADDCSQCGFACPSPTCPWTCCGLREEQQAVQEEEQVIQEETGADCSQCGLACPSPNCPWVCCGLVQEEQAIQEEEQALQSAPEVSCKPDRSLCQADAQCCSGYCFNKQICMAPR